MHELSCLGRPVSVAVAAGRWPVASDFSRQNGENRPVAATVALFFRSLPDANSVANIMAQAFGRRARSQGSTDPDAQGALSRIGPTGAPDAAVEGSNRPPLHAPVSVVVRGGAQMVESSGEPVRPLDGPTAMPQWWTLFGRRHTAVRSQLRSQPSFRSLRPGRRFGR